MKYFIISLFLVSIIITITMGFTYYEINGENWNNNTINTIERNFQDVTRKLRDIERRVHDLDGL